MHHSSTAEAKIIWYCSTNINHKSYNTGNPIYIQVNADLNNSWYMLLALLWAKVRISRLHEDTLKSWHQDYGLPQHAILCSISLSST